LLGLVWGAGKDEIQAVAFGLEGAIGLLGVFAATVVFGVESQEIEEIGASVRVFAGGEEVIAELGGEVLAAGEGGEGGGEEVVEGGGIDAVLGVVEGEGEHEAGGGGAEIVLDLRLLGLAQRRHEDAWQGV
jgi:hypothetical protein